MFELEKINNNLYTIFFVRTKKEIGKAVRQEDGYFGIELIHSPGSYWTDYSLIEIGNLIKDLNKPFDEKCINYDKDLDDLEDDINDLSNLFKPNV